MYQNRKPDPKRFVFFHLHTTGSGDLQEIVQIDAVGSRYNDSKFRVANIPEDDIDENFGKGKNGFEKRINSSGETVLYRHEYPGKIIN